MIDLEISIVISNLSWSPWKKLNSPRLYLPYCKIFKTGTPTFEFRSPGYGWKKNKKKEKKNTDHFSVFLYDDLHEH